MQAQEGAHLVELLVAVRTLVLLVGVMSLQVAHLGGGVGEGAATVVALVGFLATVYQLVALEVAGSGEELATVPAAVARLPRVPLLVQVQEADEAVALAALLTPIGFQRAAGQRCWVIGRGARRVPNRRPVWRRQGVPVCLLVSLAGRRVREGLAALPA